MMMTMMMMKMMMTMMTMMTMMMMITMMRHTKEDLIGSHWVLLGEEEEGICN